MFLAFSQLHNIWCNLQKTLLLIDFCAWLTILLNSNKYFIPVTWKTVPNEPVPTTRSAMYEIACHPINIVLQSKLEIVAEK